MARVFPELTPETERRLSAIQRLAEKDPEYFSDPRCPYDKQIQEMLKRLIYGGGVSHTRIEIFKEGMNALESADAVLEEVQSTIEEMKGIEQEINNSAGVEPADKVNFYKAKTQMLERWTQLKERVINMKQMSQFQREIVRFMEEVLDKDQQQQFKQKIKEFS